MKSEQQGGRKMGKVVILTDSSSGIRQAEAQQLGISVLPMPFFINGEITV